MTRANAAQFSVLVRDPSSFSPPLLLLPPPLLLLLLLAAAACSGWRGAAARWVVDWQCWDWQRWLPVDRLLTSRGPFVTAEEVRQWCLQLQSL